MNKILQIIKKRVLQGAAIYISDDFIDVAKADLTLKGLRVSYLQRFPVLKNIKDIYSKEAKDQISAVLEKAYESEEGRPYRIAVNLKNEYFILRRFTFKGIAPAEVEKAILFESQKHIPYAVEDLSFRFKKCAKKGNDVEVAFGASEIKNINNLTQYFTEKNIVPSIVEATPALITRGLSLERKLEKNKPYIAIHYEPTNKVIITGVWRKYPYFFREINVFPGEEEFKTTELSYPSLQDAWGMIGNDVLSAVEYLKKEAQEDIDRMFISGFSYTQDEETISEEFGIPFERANLSYFASAGIENRDRFLPVLSLLYETLHDPLFNLAPGEIACKDLWTFRPVAEKAMFFLAGIVALHLILGGVNVAQEKKIKSAKSKIAIYKIVSPNSSRTDVIRYKDAIKEKAEEINKFISGRIHLTEKLNQLGKDMVPNAWIDSISFQNPIGTKMDNVLKIDGSIYVATTGDAQINDILERLKADNRMMVGFKDLKLVSVEKKRLGEKEIKEFKFILR